ncbi:MAG: SAM-dependent chlorinase/fluorinase [Anaerolineales bacterium]|nr:SAM-dependent chlorinase/fluorinase [Anaerolineales bacterium]
MSYISILTDFGGPVGVMEGVMWNIAPDAQISHIAWDVSPQNVLEGSLVLDRQGWFYPDGTVHVVVIDPGVGTDRRPIAAKIGTHYFVGPDNGVFTAVYQRAEKHGWPIKVVHTNKPEYWLPEVSEIFHGRDIFSPVGAHLAAGVPLEDLGEEIDDAVRIDLPLPERLEDNTVVGQITMVWGHLGNVIVNIHRDDVAHLDKFRVRLCGVEITEIVRTFGDRETGTIVALFGSSHYLNVAVVNGSAREVMHPKVGDKVEVIPV